MPIDILRPSFNRETARSFLRHRHRDDEIACLVLGYTKGIVIGPGGADRFDEVLDRAEREQTHLFFHVANLKPEWGNAASHAKGEITSASKTNAVLADGSASHVLDCS